MTRHRPSTTAKLGVALCFVAVALLAYGLKTDRWFSVRSPVQYGQAGLRMVTLCSGDGQRCESQDWTQVASLVDSDALGTFQTAAKVVTGVGLATCAFLLLSAILLVMGKFVFVPFAPSSAAILLCMAAVAAALYAAQKSPVYELGFRSDFSLIAFLMGAAVGFAGAIFVGRERPDDWL